MFHRGNKLMRPGDIMKISLMLLDNFMGKMPCRGIFGKYIALDSLQ